MEDYEKKYKEAIEAVKELMAANPSDDGIKAWVWDKFPELMESKDEEIRKEIISAVNLYCTQYLRGNKVRKDMLAWLEKQSEHVNKVEPNFKAGEWYVDKQDGTILQITKVLRSTYKYITNTGEEHYCEHCCLEQDTHLWNIQDAKPGDVLSDGTTIFIFKDLLSDGSVMSYCDYDTDSGESDAFCSSSVNLMCSKITPVIKEQRDLLFKKIQEAGYEWDAEHKQLKKIEQNPAWDEVDESKIDNLCHFLLEYGNQYYGHVTLQDVISWLKSLKDKVQPKQEWSEDDDKKRKGLIKGLEDRMGFGWASDQFSREEYIDWLKSIRPKERWKPSDEQMAALNNVFNDINAGWDDNVIESLYNDLKKLREE